MTNPAAFFAEALPYAEQAHRATGVLTSVILAQWADETAYGGVDWSIDHNPGNVGSFDGQPVRRFPSLAEGVQAYISTMNLGYYAGVRSAGSAVEQIIELGRSPWASSHYGHPPGADLLVILLGYDLTRYDAGVPATSGGGGSAGPPPSTIPGPSSPTLEDCMGLAWSPDGTKIAAVGNAGDFNDHLLVFAAEGEPGVIDLTDAVAATPAAQGKLWTVNP